MVECFVECQRRSKGEKTKENITLHLETKLNYFEIEFCNQNTFCKNFKWCRFFTAVSLIIYTAGSFAKNLIQYVCVEWGED